MDNTDLPTLTKRFIRLTCGGIKKIIPLLKKTCFFIVSVIPWGRISKTFLKNKPIFLTFVKKRNQKKKKKKIMVA